MGNRILGLIKNSARGEKGVSLIEAMVSMTVLTVGMLGLAGLFTYSATSFGSSAHTTDAAGIATNRLAAFKMMSSTALMTSGNKKGEVVNNMSYNSYWTAAKLPNTDPKKELNMMKVSVLVNWSSSSGKAKRPHHIKITTLLTGNNKD